MERRNFIRLMAASPLATTLSCHSQSTGESKTISQQEGPYYPIEPIPLQNNLLITNYHSGVELQLSGSVRNVNGSPLVNARIEIWQCDGAGVYSHPAAPNEAAFDPHFAGSGATLTSSTGHYEFITIMPVPYTGRPPHIHTKVFVDNRERLTSQIYLSDSGGHKRLKMDPVERENSVYSATFDFVV